MHGWQFSHRYKIYGDLSNEILMRMMVLLKSVIIGIQTLHMPLNREADFDRLNRSVQNYVQSL